MYLDQPQNIQYYGILKALYKQNNIRNEIGGTVESIKEINEDLLYTCYNTFYHPSNMVLAIVGKFDIKLHLKEKICHFQRQNGITSNQYAVNSV